MSQSGLTKPASAGGSARTLGLAINMSGDSVVLASLIGAVLSLGIGAWYFLRAPSESSLLLRIATSAYAPSTAVLYAFAFAVPREVWLRLGTAALFTAQSIPAVFLVVSLVGYPGSKKLHLLLVPPALFFWLCQFAIAQIAVYGM